MPYKKEHAARLNQPNKYQSIRRKNGAFGDIDAIFGILTSGKTEVQALRFPSNKYTPAQAKEWLKEHKYSPIEFEEAIEDKKDGETSNRFDTGEVLTFHRTPEGYLRGVAKVTRSGVLTYMNGDGSKRKEYRPKEEVFKADSIESMKMIPVTNGHPKELITSENVKELSIGYTGERVDSEGDYITIPITIVSADGISAIEAGRRELSLGYTVQLEESQGVYNGDSYDCIQRNIKYNHLAIVDIARAGSACRLNIDGFTDASTQIDNIEPLTDGGAQNMAEENKENVEQPISTETVESPAEEIKQEGPVVEGDKKEENTDGETTDQKLETALKRIDELNAEVAELKAKADSLLEENKKFNADGFISEAREMAKKRIELEASALKAVKLDGIEKLSDKEIILATIKNAKPDFKEDGFSDDYLRARFDSIVELAEINVNNNPDAIKIKNDGSAKIQDIDMLKKEYRKKLENAYKNK